MGKILLEDNYPIIYGKIPVTAADLPKGRFLAFFEDHKTPVFRGY